MMSASLIEAESSGGTAGRASRERLRTAARVSSSCWRQTGHAPRCSPSASHASRVSAPSRYGEKAFCDSSQFIITSEVRGRRSEVSRSQSLTSDLRPLTSHGWLADPGCSLFEEGSSCRGPAETEDVSPSGPLRAVREERVLLAAFSKPLSDDPTGLFAPPREGRLRRFLTLLAPGVG